MTDKLKVKVIKKGEVKPIKTVAPKTSTPANSAREMVSTVTEWVADFKERKSEETKAAIERFFVAHPRPSAS